MTGAAGHFAKTYAGYLETPEPFLFMSYLTILGHVISSKLTLDSELARNGRLYTILLGQSADARKSTSINKALDFFTEALPKGAINLVLGVGSAEGLARGFRSSPKVLFVQDELKALIQKMKIDASVLLPCINSLFEDKRYHSLTKQHTIRLDEAELVILAASTLDTYQHMFTGQFLDIGFVNRLFIVIGDSERKFPIPVRLPDAKRTELEWQLRQVIAFAEMLVDKGRCLLSFTPEANDIYNAWYFGHERSVFAKRLDTYGHRLSVLLAINGMVPEITAEIVRNVVKLLDYQVECRRYADPIDADTAIARVEESIRRALHNRGMSKRGLERRCHKSRVGSWAFNAALKNLLGAREIIYNPETKAYQVFEDEER